MNHQILSSSTESLEFTQTSAVAVNLFCVGFGVLILNMKFIEKTRGKPGVLYSGCSCRIENYKKVNEVH